MSPLAIANFNVNVSTNSGVYFIGITAHRLTAYGEASPNSSDEEISNAPMRVRRYGISLL